MNEKLILILSVVLAVLVLVVFGIALDYFLSPYEGLSLADYKKQVNSTLSDQEFVQELINQNIEQKQMIDDLEEERANQEIVIGYLMNRLNISLEVQASPFSRIDREDIRVYSDRIVIYANKAFPASFTESKSMYPFIREGAFALEVKPENSSELKTGDIIGFESKAFNTTIIHRIIEIGEDEQGWYAITKGDNNPALDPGKVRFNEIIGVLVGLIY